MGLGELPEGWVVWNEEPNGRVILAYRPDVFDGEQFPAPCLPTIYVSDGSLQRRPGAGQRRGEGWHVRLTLEPDIDAVTEQFDSRASALEGATGIAEEFATGSIDYRSLYQVPRPEYFGRLDELTGRDE